MNMQNLLAQAQKMQRELKKAQEELAQEEFTASKGGAVSVVAYGDRKIKSISIEPSALEVDNKEMLEEMLKLAIEEVMGNIKLAEEELNARITGRAEGMMGL
jgi:hypothetical protein